MSEQTRVQTPWTRATDLALTVAVHTPILSRCALWRILWGATVNSWCYEHLRRPWYTGHYWTEQ